MIPSTDTADGHAVRPEMPQLFAFCRENVHDLDHIESEEDADRLACEPVEIEIVAYGVRYPDGSVSVGGNTDGATLGHRFGSMRGALHAHQGRGASHVLWVSSGEPPRVPDQATS